MLFLLIITITSHTQDLSFCQSILQESISIDYSTAYGASEEDSATIPAGSLVEFVGETPDQNYFILRYNNQYALYSTSATDIKPSDCEVSFWGVPTPNYLTLNEVMSRTGITTWHEAEYWGDGVRVGVLDTRYDDLDQLIVSLPLSSDQFMFVQPLNDLMTLLPRAEGTEPFHGTNVIEILTAIAPQADYVIARSVGAESFQSAVDSLIAADVDIIVHAGNIITTDPTPYHTAVRRAVNEHEILWINSAGNIGAGYFPGRFTGGGVLGTRVHSFQDPNVVGDARNTLLVPVSRERDIQVTLQWDDPAANFSLITLGSCNQNDPESFAPIVTDAIEGMLTARQTIGTDALQQISDYTRVPAPAALQTCANNPDGIQDNEIHIGVRSDNAETETPFSLYIQGALPAEYDPDMQQSLDPVVLVPGDLPEVLTVGAFDPRTNRMAWYSGRSNSLQYYELNNFDVDYSDDELVKPNLVTYGEILLPSGRQFFGTSASTPVVAGAAILAYRHDELPNIDTLTESNACLLDGAVGVRLPFLLIFDTSRNQKNCGQYPWRIDLSSQLVSEFKLPELIDAQNVAEENVAVVRSQSLASQALNSLDDSQFDLALLLSVEALNVSETSEALNVLITTMQKAGGIGNYLYDKPIGFTANSQKLTTISSLGGITIWDMSNDYALKERYVDTDPIKVAVQSPDRNLIIIGEADGDVLFYDILTTDIYKITSMELETTHEITQLEVNASNTELIIVIADTAQQKPYASTFILWDIDSQSQIDQITSQAEEGSELVFKFVNHNMPMKFEHNVIDNVKTLTITDMRTGETAHYQEFINYGMGLYNHEIIFDKNNTLLAISNFQTVYVWDLLSLKDDYQEFSYDYDSLGGEITGSGHISMSFSDDGDRLAVSVGSFLGSDSAIIIWDLKTGNIVSAPYIHNESALVNFAPDENFLIFTSCEQRTVGSLCLSGRVFVLDITEKRITFDYVTPEWNMAPTIASPDGRFVVTEDSNSSTGVLSELFYEALLRPLTRNYLMSDRTTFPDHTCDLGSATISPNGRTIGCIRNRRNSDNTMSYNPESIVLIDVGLGRTVELPTVDPELSWLMPLQFSLDSQLFASTVRHGYVSIWDTNDYQKIREIDLGEDTIPGNIEFTPDNEFVAFSIGSSTQIWSLENGLLFKKLEEEWNPIFGHESGTLFTWNSEGRREWNIFSDEVKQDLPSITFYEPVDGVVSTISPSRNFIAGSTGGRVGITGISNFRTGQPFGHVLSAIDDTYFITDHAFSSDDRFLAVVSDFGVHLWDVQSQIQIGDFLGTGTPLAIQFHSDENILFVFSGQDYWQIDLRSSTLIHAACRIANRQFTQAEWGAFFPDEPYNRTCDNVDISTTQ